MNSRGFYFDTSDSENSRADDSSLYIRGEYGSYQDEGWFAYSDICAHGSTGDGTKGSFVIQNDETDLLIVNFDGSKIIVNTPVEISASSEYSFIARGSKAQIYCNDSTSERMLEFSADGTQIGKIWGVNRDIELDCDDGYNVKLNKTKFSDITSDGLLKTAGSDGSLMVSTIIQGITGVFGVTGIQGITGFYGVQGIDGTSSGLEITGEQNYIPLFVDSTTITGSIFYVNLVTIRADILAITGDPPPLEEFEEMPFRFSMNRWNGARNISIIDDTRSLSNGIIVYHHSTNKEQQTPIGISSRYNPLTPETPYSHGAFTIYSDGTDLYALRNDGKRAKMTNGLWL